MKYNTQISITMRLLKASVTMSDVLFSSEVKKEKKVKVVSQLSLKLVQPW
ncbi:Uncharacterised protein [Streptococcus pneumoniae]|nr:Uncharacterised protein [Streptococcus pneumoniae]